MRENQTETDKEIDNNEKKQEGWMKRNKTRRERKKKQKQRNLNKTLHRPSWSKMGLGLISLVVAQRLRFGDHGHRNKQVHVRASFAFLLLHWHRERYLLRSVALKFHHDVCVGAVRTNTEGKNKKNKNKKGRREEGRH